MVDSIKDLKKLVNDERKAADDVITILFNIFQENCYFIGFSCREKEISRSSKNQN